MHSKLNVGQWFHCKKNIAFKQVSVTLGWASAGVTMQTELLPASQVNVYKLKVKKTNTV